MDTIFDVLRNMQGVTPFEGGAFLRDAAREVSSEDLLVRLENATDVPEELASALRAISDTNVLARATDQVFQLVLYARTQESDPHQVLRNLRRGIFFSAGAGRTTLKNTLTAARKLSKNQEKIRSLKEDLLEINEKAASASKESRTTQKRAEKKEDQLRDAEGKNGQLQSEFVDELSRIYANLGKVA